MPLSTMMKPEGMPEEMMRIAAAQDDLIAEKAIERIPPPSKPYNIKVLNALSRALADLGKAMELDLTAVTYDEPAEQLDRELVRFLSMMADAAADYGQPLPVALDAIKGDKELTAITAHLMKLAKDKDFAAFLGTPTREEVTIEMRPDSMEVEEKEDFDFASRMRRR